METGTVEILPASQVLWHPTDAECGMLEPLASSNHRR